MTVFKGYLKGALRQKTVVLLYLAIFLGLGTLMTLSMDENNTGTYEAQTITMAVEDRDHTVLSKGLRDWLRESQDVVDVEDKKEVLQEELYYGNLEYVLVIPKGFQQKMEEAAKKTGEEQKALLEDILQGTGRPDSAQGQYASRLAGSYLSGMTLYLSAGYSAEDAVKEMKTGNAGGSVVVMAQGSSKMTRTAGTLTYLPYILLALSCYVIGFVMVDYQREEIRRRLEVSAVSSTRRLVQMLAAFAVIGAAFWAVGLAMTALMNTGTIAGEPNKGWYMLNVACMTLTGLMAAFFVVHAAHSANAVNGLANVIALGMSFLSGVFIPESMLGESVKKVAKFLPVYWYEQNNTILGTHSSISAALQERLMEGFGKQLVGAAVIFVLGLAVRKIRDR